MKKLHGGKDARSALLEDEPMEKYLKFHETSFNKLSEGQKSIKYYAKFQFCQVLNLVILSFNWFITNQFLNRLFTSYGSEVVAYLNNPIGHNPMCNAFPTVVSSNFKKEITCISFSSSNTQFSESRISISPISVVAKWVFLFNIVSYIFLRSLLKWHYY